MPVPLMTRLDDDVAPGLRELSARTHAPMNRLINDAIRKLLVEAGVLGSPHASPDLAGALPAKIEEARAAIDGGEVQRSLELLLDCVVAGITASHPDFIAKPTVAPIDRSVSQQEVRA